MNKKIHINIEDLLTNKRRVQSALPSVAEIIETIKKSKKINLVYGETYDHFGLTVDSLKYYFFTSILHSTLEARGIQVSSTIVIGDLHSVKNKLVENKQELLNQAQIRLKQIHKIKSVYNLKIETVLMSDLFTKDTYQKRLREITEQFKTTEELKNIAKKTILQNRVSQEEETGYQYTLEEVALITNYDIKIGPPREVYFDELARELGPKVSNHQICGLYLKPTYPLGFNFDYFVNHPEVEEFGLTPYKAGSNRLQDHRIILGKTSLNECRQLIDTSFISSNPALPNPVFDIYLIATMAGYLLNSEPLGIENYEKIEIADFKKAAYKSLAQNIYKPLEFN